MILPFCPQKQTWSFTCLIILLLSGTTFAQEKLNNQQIDGYRGIWFTLGQFSAYGDKYSGGLGTYTAKHRPLAIYAPEVDQTFFVYGGTTKKKEKYLLCMIGKYDHQKDVVERPTVVYDKLGVDDPHDNPSLLIDEAGYLWVFVSGRGRNRPGFKYRSKRPYDIADFEQITEEEMTYPQPWYVPGEGFFHFFTKYTGVRELYFETSADGRVWTEDQKIAGIKGPDEEKSGHYQVSARSGNKVATFFSRHPNGNVDQRTNLYYVQSPDFGTHWETVYHQPIQLPITEVVSPALVMDYESASKNVYLKDMAFDQDGHPVCLYLTSGGHEPGPDNGPREWRVTYWRGESWFTSTITTSDHNYDMGSLWIDDTQWTVVAPAAPGPTPHGSGGALEIWRSTDRGHSWSRQQTILAPDQYNHNYVRSVIDGQSPFLFFWADGHPHQQSKSQLYFSDFSGVVRKLPYRMRRAQRIPKTVNKRK